MSLPHLWEERCERRLAAPYFELVDSETRRAVEAAATTFEDLGAQVDWVDGPDVDPGFDGFHHVWADLAHHHRGSRTTPMSATKSPP